MQEMSTITHFTTTTENILSLTLSLDPRSLSLDPTLTLAGDVRKTSDIGLSGA